MFPRCPLPTPWWGGGAAGSGVLVHLSRAPPPPTPWTPPNPPHHFEWLLPHPFSILCNGGQHYAPYRWLLISNKLCDPTVCTCGGVGGGGRNRCIILIMTLDPGDKHQYCLRQDRTRVACVIGGHSTPILIFTYPGSRIQKQQQKRGVKKNLFS